MAFGLAGGYIKPRDAAAALARRLPLYYGSGEPADEGLAQAREVLRYVEWLPGDLRPDEPRWCMVCMSYEPQHAPDCALNAALAAKE